MSLVSSSWRLGIFSFVGSAFLTWIISLFCCSCVFSAALFPFAFIVRSPPVHEFLSTGGAQVPHIFGCAIGPTDLNLWSGIVSNRNLGRDPKLAAVERGSSGLFASNI